jgi:hypothetical protein
MFLSTDRPEPYYIAGFALYKLNSAFNTSKLPTTLKIARYHILLTARLLIDAGPLPRMNANEMEKRCTLMMDRLWNDFDKLLSDAATRFSEIVAGNLDRDHIHTQGSQISFLKRSATKKGNRHDDSDPCPARTCVKKTIPHFSATLRPLVATLRGTASSRPPSSNFRSKRSRE